MPILCGSEDQCTSDRIQLLAVHDVRDALAQFELISQGTAQNRHFVACTWSELPDLPGLIDDVIQRMGETAGRLWPHWYGVTLPRNGNIDELLAAVSHSPLYHDGIGSALMAPWLQAAAARCESVRLPLPAGFSKAAHLRQLALAVAPNGLEFLLCTDSISPPPKSLYGLARATEWIAQETGCEVSVLVPHQIADSLELDSISFSSSPLESIPSDPPTPERHEEAEKAACVVWPIQGRPHPNSPGEQLLAERIEKDERLRGLFEFNIKIQTVCHHTFQVDLVWRSGKVIVEVDGYHWHSCPTAFSSDRHRDYELLISGYLTLRLPHNEVMNDVETVIRKINDVVRFRHHERSAT